MHTFGDIRAFFHQSRFHEATWLRLRAVLSKLFYAVRLGHTDEAQATRAIEYVEEVLKKGDHIATMRRPACTHWTRPGAHRVERRALALCDGVDLSQEALRDEGWRDSVNLSTLTRLTAHIDDRDDTARVRRLLEETPALEELHVVGSDEIEWPGLGDDAELFPSSHELEALHTLSFQGMADINIRDWLSHDCPESVLARLKVLDLSDNELADDSMIITVLEALAAVGTTLKRLDVSGHAEVGLNLIDAIAGSSCCAELEHLGLAHGHLDDGGHELADLAGAPFLHKLRELDLEGNQFRFGLFEELEFLERQAEGDTVRPLSSLRRLKAGWQDFWGPADLMEITRTFFVGQLTHLDLQSMGATTEEPWRAVIERLPSDMKAINLSDNRLDRDALDALREKFTHGPEELHLHQLLSPIPPGEVVAWLKPVAYGELRALSIGFYPLTDAHLADFPSWHGEKPMAFLESLCLSHTELTGEGIANLLQDVHPERLTTLALKHNPLVPCERLTGMLREQAVERLCLSHSPDADEVALLAIIAACAPTIRALDVSYAPRSAAFFEALARIHLPALTTIDFHRSDAPAWLTIDVLRGVR